MSSQPEAIYNPMNLAVWDLVSFPDSVEGGSGDETMWDAECALCTQ